MPSAFTSRLRRFFNLSLREKLLLFEALAFNLAARAGLSIVPYRGLEAGVERMGAGKQHSPPSPADERAEWAVRLTKALTPGSTCLTQSLALQAMLRRRGRPAHIRIGVAKAGDGSLDAHAWVELEGKTYLEGAEVERYATMPSPKRP